jgi:3-dehydroquinate synthase
LEGDRESCQTAVEQCVRAKARIVADDPNDTAGTRALLNLGHTFGHAIEAVAGDVVLHGEAVALGMILAFEFSVRIGSCQAEDAARVRTHFKNAGLPTNIGDVGLDNRRREIVDAMLSDKKADRDGLVLILARGIGAAFAAKGVELEKLSEFLEHAA